jgi:hypothetical protein
MWNEECGMIALAIINEELKIENSSFKHRSEARIIQHSTLTIHN